MVLKSYSSGIHYTGEIVEWAVFCKQRSGQHEKIREGSLPIPAGFFEAENAPLFPDEVLSELRRELRGIITASIPSSRLLMRVLELPSADSSEIKSMVDLQIDRISPYPLDQLTVSYEVLRQNEDSSRVLAVAAQRRFVDELGDLFKEKHIHIRSLDAEVLAWWSLLTAAQCVPTEGRAVLILEEHTEFSMIVVDDGVPVSFRSLELFHDFSDESVMDEIAGEVSYTLLSLETEYGARPTAGIHFWSEGQVPPALQEALAEHCGTDAELHDLCQLPSLSEGLALRSAERQVQHTELVPREWIELQRRRRLMKAATIGTAAVLGIWLVSVVIMALVLSIQNAGFRRVEKTAARYAGPAREAQTAREEMVSLEQYADRSHSALECLREITLLLPDDIEISSFNYKKGNAVTLRGSSERSEVIYDYFQQLGASELFEGVKDQPVSTRTVKGQRISTFSITAELPKPEKQGGE